MQLASIIGRWRTSVRKNHLPILQNLEAVYGGEMGREREGLGMSTIRCDKLQGAELSLWSVIHDGQQCRIFLSGGCHVPGELREQSCLIRAGRCTLARVIELADYVYCKSERCLIIQASAGQNVFTETSESGSQLQYCFLSLSWLPSC